MYSSIKHNELVIPPIGVMDQGFDDLLEIPLDLHFFKCFPWVLRKTGLNRDEREVATNKATSEASCTFLKLYIHVRPPPSILVCLPETICL